MLPLEVGLKLAQRVGVLGHGACGRDESPRLAGVGEGGSATACGEAGRDLVVVLRAALGAPMLATISAASSALQLLGDLRTPTLVVDLGQSFDIATSSLTDRIFVHARVAELEPAPGLLARLDCTLERCGGTRWRWGSATIW